MFSVLRPFLFNLDPETAHDLAVKSLKFNPLPSAMFRVEDEEMLNIELLGKNFPNPIGLAAGFDKSAEVYNSLLKLGFGFVEVGTVTPLKQLGNPKPRIFRLEKDKAIINRNGFNNLGMLRAKKKLERYRKRFPEGSIFLVGVNIGPNKDSKDRFNDYKVLAEKLSEFADYISINVSSPNTPNLREFQKKENLVLIN